MSERTSKVARSHLADKIEPRRCKDGSAENHRGAARHAVGMAGCRQPLALMGPTVCSALFVLP